MARTIICLSAGNETVSCCGSEHIPVIYTFLNFTMQILRKEIVLYCHPTWPPYHVGENQELVAVSEVDLKVPKVPLCYLMLGIFLFLGARACVQLNRFEEAISWCDKGLKVSFLITRRR